MLVGIEAASAGNPLYALEIARALGPTSTLRLNPPVPLPDPGFARVAHRPPHCRPPGFRPRRALLLAAAAAEPTPDTLERALPGRRPPLGPAIDDRIVEARARDGPVHPPADGPGRAGARRPAAFRSAHVALASATPSAEARARHLGQAADGPDEAVARALAAAAAVARLRGATLDAVALFLEAGGATPVDLRRPPPRATHGWRRSASSSTWPRWSRPMAILARRSPVRLRGPPAPGAQHPGARPLLPRAHPRRRRDGEQALAEVGDEDGSGGRGSSGVSRSSSCSSTFSAAWRSSSRLPRCSRGADERPVDPDLLANVLLLRADRGPRPRPADRPADVDRGLRLITANGRSWEREGADGIAFGLAR